MKRVHHPINVRADAFWPVEIRAGGRSYRVHEVLDHWVVESRWLTGGRRRVYFRVLTGIGTFEICREGGGSTGEEGGGTDEGGGGAEGHAVRWLLCKIFD